MMLPSGNDAAYAIAEFFGKQIIDRKKEPSSSQILSGMKNSINTNSKFANSTVVYFLKEMNNQANKLGMLNSNYDSPHGLMNKSNYSTANDQVTLVDELMKIDIARRVVNTVEHETQAVGGRDRHYLTVYIWENTNKLLEKLPGIIGTKTGITQAAGPCFAGYYEDLSTNIKLIIILCHSSSMAQRWEEVKLIVDWYKQE
jgi:D-alanyl-D-alanine carboxypeptidase (penicillin-binding protein 5/6)